MLNQEEERLAGLLKRAVPEPPRELSAGQVTARHPGPWRGPRAAWTRPALAAAAVLVVGVTTGIVAHHSSPGEAPAPRGTGHPAASVSSPSPACTPASPVRGAAARCPAASASRAAEQIVAVPSVVGMPAAQAEQILLGAGLTVRVVESKAPRGQDVPAGTVFSQSPAAGSAVPPGAAVIVTVAAQAGA